jgi:hypothetical protein
MRSRTAVLLVLLLVLIGAPACRKEKPSAKKSPSPSPTAGATGAAFTATAVQASDAADRPQATEKANQVAPQIVDLVNTYYTAAFIDPEKWGGGKHGDLAAVFSGSVQGQVAGQIQGLALGDLAPKIKSVKPGKQEVTIKVDVEEDLSTPVITAVTLFEATAQTKNKAEGPVKIVHQLRMFLVPDAGSFKIAGGTAELKADSEAAAMRPIEKRALWGSGA